MSSLKKNIKKSMHAIMLDCDTATLLLTKREYTKLSCIEKMKLSMHLAGCKYCRRFAKQSNTISHQISQMSKIDDEHHHHLSEEQKNNIIKKIEKHTLTK